MKLKTILGFAAVAFILLFVIKDPGGATHVLNNIASFLSSIAHGFSKLWGSL